MNNLHATKQKSKPQHDPRPIAFIQILSTQAKTLFDSGATHSAMSTGTAERLQQLGIRVEPSTFRISDVQGNALKVHGIISVPVCINKRTFRWSFLVIQNLENDVIIGADFMNENKLSINMETNEIIFNNGTPWMKKSLNSVYKTFVPENHHVKVKCSVKTPDNVSLKPGSLVITKRSEISPGVYIEESLTKVLRRNRIFVVITNTNPYPVFLKPSQEIGEVIDTSEVQIIPVSEARIASFGNDEMTGAIPEATNEKLTFLKENITCPSEMTEETKNQYVDLILQNHDVFAGGKYDLGYTDVISHKIFMKTEQPVYRKQFRIPDIHQSEILEHITEWTKQNVIEECSSPYNSPIFCVPKKGGGLRIVQDLREINKAAYEDKYAIRDVQECVDAIGKAQSKIFSTLDMASGFWQQNLDESSRDYTAFTIPVLNTQFRWKRTVMGLHGAPASFSRLTALVFKGIENAITYIDDLLIHSQSHLDHQTILQQCFDRMRQFGMKFNIKKCVFGAGSVTYLGFQITEDGVAPANDKIQAIRCFTAPTTMKEVRAFIGFANYFRKLIPNFSRRAGPLIAMTKKDSGWKSGQLPMEAMNSFEDIKTALGERPVIGFSRTNGQYILTVDAATTGLGAILSQINDNEETIVSYWSRTLRDHERNYTPYMLEMTAVCSALEHFHENVFGKKVIVYTDHRPLLGTSTIQKKTINRLVENLNIYQIDLRYKKGCENQGADYLSRNADAGLCEIRQHDRYENIRKYQQDDQLVSGVRKFLNNNVLPTEDFLTKKVLLLASRCFIKDKVVWFVPPKTSKDKAVLLTPESMVPTIITNAHGKPMSGHWGVERTIHRISTSYFWTTMSRDVTKFISRCGPCQRARRPPPNASLTPWQPATKPHERVHIDLFGALKGDPNFKYVAVITCAFTKWTEVIPITDKEAPTVAKAVFEEWICRRGVMQQLVSDGGKEFANHILDELCKLMNIKKHVVTPYHPMANGQVERFNRDMKKYLLTMLEDTSDWVQYLKPLQFAHNTSVSKSTKYTPHFLTFLDDPRLPDTLETPNITYSSTYSADAFRRMQYAYRLVYKNNAEARLAYTTHFNAKAKARHFEVGDEILISFPVNAKTVNKKLATIWKGPFSVIKVADKNILYAKASPHSKTIHVHTNRVRFFQHFNDLITTPAQDQVHNEPTLEQVKNVNKNDDDDDDEDGEDVNEDEDIVNEDGQNPIPVAPDAQAVIPARDQLAAELFGRFTRARGPVADETLPKRALEYKKYEKRKK